MIVELIPKREKKPIFGQMFFIIVSLAALIGVIATFFVFRLFVENAKAELTRLERTFLEDTRPLEEELEKRLSEQKRKADLLYTVLEERRIFSPVFNFLEATTHPDVFFRSLQGDAETGVFSLEGEAINFLVLEQQRLVWNEQNSFVGHLESMSLGSGGTASFQVEFVANPELLRPL